MQFNRLFPRLHTAKLQDPFHQCRLNGFCAHYLRDALKAKSLDAKNPCKYPSFIRKIHPLHGNFPCSLIWFCVAVGIIFLRCANGNCWWGTGNETSIKLKRMHTNRKSFIIKAHSALRTPPLFITIFPLQFIPLPLFFGFSIEWGSANQKLFVQLTWAIEGKDEELAERKRKLQVRSECISWDTFRKVGHQLPRKPKRIGEEMEQWNSSSYCTKAVMRLPN